MPWPSMVKWIGAAKEEREAMEELDVAFQAVGD